MQRFFDESATSQIEKGAMLAVNKREIPAKLCAKGIAWFDFPDLCDGPRSQDQARRFVALVDEFYDRRVKLIVSAAAEPANLYTGSKLRFDFERTTSRLIEMQSTDYLAAPHLA